MRLSVVGVALASAIITAWNRNILRMVVPVLGVEPGVLFIPLYSRPVLGVPPIFGALASHRYRMTVWVLCEFVLA